MSDGRIPSFTLYTHNIFYKNRRPHLIAANIKAIAADVVCLQEVTSNALDAISHAGALDGYSHRITEPSKRSAGLAILSRYPLGEHRTTAGIGYPLMRVSMAVGGHRVTLFNVHTRAPLASIRKWRADLGDLESAMRRETDPTVAAGDFNATCRNPVLRKLTGAGFSEAHQHCGRPQAGTWPTFAHAPAVFGDVLRIDHIFAGRGISPISVRETNGCGSDHRGLVTELTFEVPHR